MEQPTMQELQEEVTKLREEKEYMLVQIKAREDQVATVESLLQDCMSTMDNIHGYDYDSYHAASRYFSGDDSE